MNFNKGGIVPDSYGLTLTVYAKEAVEVGTPLVFDATQGDYGVRKATQGEVPQLFSKLKESEVGVPISAFVVGYSRNLEVQTSGTVKLGDTLVLAADGTLKAETVAEGGTAKSNILVVAVDTAYNTAEVLI